MDKQKGIHILSTNDDETSRGINEANKEIIDVLRIRDVNVKQQRLMWLQQHYKDTYVAVQWLRDNKHLFTGEVYEPMVLELNVLDPNHSIYIENFIDTSDKLAFTCTLREDMDLLRHSLRQQKDVDVNIIHSGADQPSLQSYQPPFPIAQIRKYGFFAYIQSLITAPDPLLQYLCRIYGMHKTPVGDQTTNDHYKSVPDEILSFFSDEFKFTSTYSRYTKEKSTMQQVLQSDESFSSFNSMDDYKNISEESEKYNVELQNWKTQAVDVVGQAGKPKTATGFQTHTTPVLLAHGERAELATEESIPLPSIME